MISMMKYYHFLKSLTSIDEIVRNKNIDRDDSPTRPINWGRKVIYVCYKLVQAKNWQAYLPRRFQLLLQEVTSS